MFSLFLNIPPFLIWHFDEARDSCVYIYPEEWMAVGYNLLWDALAFFPLVLMVVTYSRVVYTLWFKRFNFQNNQHQIVSISASIKTLLILTSQTQAFIVTWYMSGYNNKFSSFSIQIFILLERFSLINYLVY